MRKSWKRSSSSLRMILAPMVASLSRALMAPEAWPARVASREVLQ